MCFLESQNQFQCQCHPERSRRAISILKTKIMNTTIKNFSKILLVAITIFSMSTSISCSKDDEAPAPIVQMAPAQNPLDGYLVATGYNQETVPRTNDGQSYGHL